MKNAKMLCGTYALILRKCGLGGCFYTFGAGVLSRVLPESKAYSFFMKKKHEKMLAYLEKALGAVVSKYAGLPTQERKPNDGNLWVFWWQGEESAPPVVKRCLENLRRHSGARAVTVVDKDNLSRFVTLPPFILEKVEKGIITPKFLSDIVRSYLLRDHGGLWIDACIFLARDVPQSYFDLPFFSAHMPDDGTGRFVSRRRWTGGLMGGAAQSAFFGFIADCLTVYCEKHDGLLNVLLIDYIIELGVRRVEALRRLVDAVPVNNSHLYDLGTCANEAFEEEAFKRLCDDTVFFRFPWRAQYSDAAPDGKPSWYGKISRG